MKVEKQNKFILWFREIGLKEIALVGGKNANLGEMYQNLTKRGINIPDGFAITSAGYWHFLDKAGIKEKIKKLLLGLKIKNLRDLAQRGYEIRQTILEADFTPELREAIIGAYRQLSKKYGQNVDVAVRSSATAEDLPGASFAGQQETYLNIRGEFALLEAVNKCFASLFTDRAIVYREEKGFDHFKVALSVGVQKMVRSDKASSGVMFTLDTESGFPGVVLINAAYGLGENVVQGKVNPDQYYVFKPTLKKGFKSIINKKIGRKQLRLVYSLGGDKTTQNVDVPPEEQKKSALTDEEILTLARWACLIEDYYSKKSGKLEPMDIEWAKDGISGELNILQARPETVHAFKEKNVLEEYKLARRGKILVTGLSIGSKIGAGKARVIKNISEINQFKKGEVLVTEMTDPDWVPIMKMAQAIVTNSGGRTCHAAIVSRELGVPCIVGTGEATRVIKNNQEITVSCAEGEEGRVYEGKISFKVKRVNLQKIKKPRTQIMMNLGEPELAFDYSFIPNEGVGLAREEFIFTNYIKIHPLALLNYKKQNPEIKKQIDELTYNYKDKTKFFIDKLAQGIAMIAAAFYPKEVIVRTSDFKTSEYAGLIGGEAFEPKESNPMIGWRGASRYYHPLYKKAFLLECQAIRKAREEMGLDNIIVMIPFCRTVEEGKKVKKIIKSQIKNRHNLKPLQIYVMVEIPSNVILADKFAKIFDGFSIGSNDLTQLTLGVDRDSPFVSQIFDERNEAVKKLISEVIKIAHKNKIKIGICGQAPSDFPRFAEFLVKEGIDSISLNPDTVLKTTLKILAVEKSLKEKRLT